MPKRLQQNILYQYLTKSRRFVALVFDIHFPDMRIWRCLVELSRTRYSTEQLETHCWLSIYACSVWRVSDYSLQNYNVAIMLHVLFISPGWRFHQSALFLSYLFVYWVIEPCGTRQKCLTAFCGINSFWGLCISCIWIQRHSHLVLKYIKFVSI